jgi:hypothetical protein
MVNYMKNLMHDDRDWDVLPPSKTVEHHLLLLRACELFHFEEGAESARKRIDSALDAGPLTADDVRMLWYAYGDSPANVDNIALNMARYGSHDADFILHFLESEISQLPPEQKEAFVTRFQGTIHQVWAEWEEEQGRRSRNRHVKIKLKRALSRVKQLLTPPKAPHWSQCDLLVSVNNIDWRSKWQKLTNFCR